MQCFRLDVFFLKCRDVDTRPQSGEATVETWPNKGVGGKGQSEQAGRDGFVSSISRGDPQKWEGGGLSGSHDFERLEKLRQTLYRNLPEGQQPSITEIYSHAGRPSARAMSSSLPTQS